MPKQSTSTTILQLKNLQTGLQTELSPTQAIALGGVTYTPATLVTKIDSHLATIQARIDAETEVRAAVAAARTDAPLVQATLGGSKAFLVAMFGAASPKLGAFGMATPARQVPTAQVKAAAVTKAEATRKARNTLGKRQKAKITGAVTPAAATTSTPIKS